MSEEIKVTVVTTHKDRVFKIIFQEKEKLLSLYNALAGTKYEDVDALEINTLEDAVYIGMKNDLSFILDGRMSLFEQQSTANPNMPLRGLFYIADLYKQKYSGKQLYSTRLIKIPTPQYIVFYNGIYEKPDRWDLRLSDAFEQSIENPDVEVVAHVININIGHNQEFLDACNPLWEYAMFNQRIRENIKQGLSKEQAVEKAIDDCIADGILTEILRKEKVRIMASILAEFDEVEYKEMLRREMKEDALIEAREEVRRDFEEVKEKMIREVRDEVAREVRDEVAREVRDEVAREVRDEVTREVREEGIQAIIETCRELGCSDSDIVSRLETKFSLKSEDARGYLNKF